MCGETVEDLVVTSFPYAYDKHAFPPEIAEYFAKKWPRDLWSIAETPEPEAIATYRWQLDCPFWKTAKGYSFNLRPIEVIREPERFQVHWDRIQNADLDYPVTVSEFGGRRVILDGLHRLAKLVLAEVDVLETRYVPKEQLECRVAGRKLEE